MQSQFNNGYAVIIGVDKTPGFELPAVKNDVDALAAVLTAPAHCAYPENQVKLITGEEATDKNILDALDWLSAATERDDNATAFIYYSGHGWQDQNEETESYYLIPHNFNKNRPHRTGIEADEFATHILNIQAERVLIVLDCCHADGMGAKGGNLIDAFTPRPFPLTKSALHTIPAYQSGEKAIGDLTNGTGRVVLNSSTKDQLSYVREDNAMSIFTYHLIEALTGHAPHSADDKTVLVTDVMSWVQRNVPQSAQNQYGKTQTPVSRLDGVFPIAMLRGGKGIARKGEPVTDPSAFLDREMYQVINNGISLNADNGGKINVGGDVVVGNKTTFGSSK